MPLQAIEGTREEIERRKAEFIGHYMRVTIDGPKAKVRKHDASANASAHPDLPKKLIGLDAFKDALPRTEEFIREKQIEFDPIVPLGIVPIRFIR